MILQYVQQPYFLPSSPISPGADIVELPVLVGLTISPCVLDREREKERKKQKAEDEIVNLRRKYRSTNCNLSIYAYDIPLTRKNLVFLTIVDIHSVTHFNVRRYHDGLGHENVKLKVHY